MRRLLALQLSVLLLTGMAARGQASNLPPDHLIKCEWNQVGVHTLIDASELKLLMACETRLQAQKRTVLAACLQPPASAGPPRVIQACTESLDYDLVGGEARALVLATRAQAYFAQGSLRQAHADYTAAIKLTPGDADLYYNRGLVSAARSDDRTALQDLDAALAHNSNFVPALLERARLHSAQGDFSGALADYSRAILLQPKNATVWSDRGQVNLDQRNYQGAVEDEAQAIQFDHHLARAYYLRSVALGDLGEQANAFSDLRTAVALDASLGRYVVIKNKAVLLSLPPL
jgi:tetratricopeptide (TPR) repeat protein